MIPLTTTTILGLGSQQLGSPHWIWPQHYPALEGHPSTLGSNLGSAPSGTGLGHSAPPGLLSPWMQ